ncbi:MAG TPA: alpha/beta fold hydrolase [Terracidiphilus sp.]
MKVSRKVLWIGGVILCLIAAVGVLFYERPLEVFNRLLYFQMSVSGAHSRWMTLNGNRIHYYEAGPEDAPPVVLVHGLGGHSEDWRMLQYFILASHRRAYMMDLPGYGRSEWPQNFSYSIPDEASTVVAFMDALGLKQVDLGGWSMGGWIAQRIAIDHPERIKRLMLFDSAGLHSRPEWQTDLFMPTTAQQLDELDKLLMPHPPQVPGFIARDILRYSHEHKWVIQRALNSMLEGKDTTDGQLPALKMPVLIVWGGEDQIMPVSNGQEMHRLIPQSEFEVIPGCGHLAPIQCSDQIGPKVKAFLGK